MFERSIGMESFLFDRSQYALEVFNMPADGIGAVIPADGMAIRIVQSNFTFDKVLQIP